MTSMNRDTDYANMAQAIRFAIRQSLKDMYTCMPGIVESYDAETRRAVVKGALKVVTTKKEEIEREAIHNVPVLFPSGGRSAFTFPLEPGDTVLLLYSQRGLANWKKTFGVAAPDTIGFLPGCRRWHGRSCRSGDSPVKASRNGHQRRNQR